MTAVSTQSAGGNPIPLPRELETFYDQLAAYLESPTPKTGAIRQLMISASKVVDRAKEANKGHIDLQKLKRDMRKLKDGDESAWKRYIQMLSRTDFVGRFCEIRRTILKTRLRHSIIKTL